MINCGKYCYRFDDSYRSIFHFEAFQEVQINFNSCIVLHCQVKICISWQIDGANNNIEFAVIVMKCKEANILNPLILSFT